MNDQASEINPGMKREMEVAARLARAAGQLELRQPIGMVASGPALHGELLTSLAGTAPTQIQFQ